MATTKPISTISYNTEPFLREKLEDWVKAHLIQAYMYICHKGEDGDKDHIHLRIEPNRKLDPMDLTEILKEYEKGKDKPLMVRPWRPSKEEDWILYAVHDPEYMRIKYGELPKGEKIEYDWKEIKANEEFDVETAYIRAKASLKHSSVNLAKRIQSGEKPADMVLQGENVFTVTAIHRAMYTNDYAKLKEENKKLTKQLYSLVAAIEHEGFNVMNDEQYGTLYVEKDDPKGYRER